ncbi:MAG: O-antigen ligase family protein [Capsulimonadales bacterium]|nr:O-antigen ligase family protein [Capsulimonadales bacterium]
MTSPMSSAPASKTGSNPFVRLLSPLPDANEYARRRRRNSTIITGLSMILSFLLGMLFTTFQLDSPILPLVLLICMVVPILVWRWPTTTLWITFAMVCAVEILPRSFKDALTDRIPFFWNFNTIIQYYAHANFKGVPLNLMEMFLLSAGVSIFLKNLYLRRLKLETGPLFVPIAIYMAFVTMGWINGVATGGDFKISLQEVRSQFYFGMAYLMAVNFITDRKRLETLCWVSIICIGIKGILYTFRRYVTIAGLPLPDQGVGSHEEVYFFDTFISLWAFLALCKVQPKMRLASLILMPTVVMGHLACNRRAGIAAIIILLPVIALAAYAALPTRRRMIMIASLVLGISFSIYYPIFKNKEGMFALPARAIKSQFSPDERDASSNAYRDAENANQMATIKAFPIQGYGYGKRFFHVYPIASIAEVYDWWDILPHNQILWVWMRVGTIGFFAFWMMMAAIIVRACRLLRRDDLEPFDQAIVLQALSAIVMLLVFGLLDLQLSNFRDMIFAGIYVGIICGPLFPRNTEAPSARRSLITTGDGSPDSAYANSVAWRGNILTERTEKLRTEDLILPTRQTGNRVGTVRPFGPYDNDPDGEPSPYDNDFPVGLHYRSEEDDDEGHERDGKDTGR